MSVASSSSVPSSSASDSAARASAAPSAQAVPGGAYPLAGRSVARVGYGAMQLERHSARPEAAASVLSHALDLGVNHLDTADFYGASFVNDVIRRVVGSLDAVARDRVIVATKVGAETNPQGPIPLRPAQRPDQLRANVEDNLRTLGSDHLDLVYLRRLEVRPGIQPEGDQDVPLDDQLETMIALRDEGLIRSIGISAVTIDTLRRAIPAGISAVQNAHSVVDRTFEDMMRLTAEHGIAWVPFFPLGSGFPGHAKVVEQPAAQAAARRLGATPSQVGLAWLLQRTPNTLIIPGTSDAAHLDENVAAGDLVLDAEAVAELDALQVVGGGEIRWETAEA
ncbi:aldo/keto reductase [Planctomonas sp. JC2975]|uniref:aldo/keto reductase n=1 Tax=Planctomonas sp. JC2975 TaxID=2729626 RepID=UPI001475F2EE|nr:aldo/keto reductase [Planctomonas sp. JC2975]NNC13683.1 aldo/keto reductase [Planctomonas sp. JC2975]